MANQGPFGFGSDDFDKFAREATEGLREVVGSLFASGSGAPKAPRSLKPQVRRVTESGRSTASTTPDHRRSTSSTPPNSMPSVHTRTTPTRVDASASCRTA